VLLTDGLCGSSSFLFSLNPGHSNKTWWIVSYGWIQFLQCGGRQGSKRLRSKLSLEWPVLIWKIALWAGRVRKFILSFGFGPFISRYITLPVSPWRHLFSHSSFELVLRICLTVLLLEGLSDCSFLAPSFASLSALSLPCRSL